MKFCFSLLMLLLFQTPVFGLCVQNTFANLRSGPSVSSDLTWKVFRYMPLQKLGKENGWYQVKDMDGKTHWIREDLVTTAYQCAVIQNEFANLRTGPGTKFPMTKAQKGIKYLSFRVLKITEDWVQLEDAQGDEVWIHRPLLWMPTPQNG